MACLITIPELAGLSMSFDVVRVDFQNESIVTEHPVEFGAEVTDNVQVRPPRFVVEAIVTDSPLLRPTAVPIPLSVDLAIQFLEQAQGKLLTIKIDGEGTWLNCILERWPHSRTHVKGRRFELGFKQIRIASALSVSIPPRLPAPVAQVGAPDEFNAGEQPTAPGVPTSTLSVGKDVITEFLGSLRSGAQ
jgi:hypothetical protein